MNRAIKFENNAYLDSVGIIHNKQNLNIVIENIKNSIIKYTIINNVDLNAGTNTIKRPTSIKNAYYVVNVVVYRGGGSTSAYYSGFNSNNIYIVSTNNYLNCNLVVYYI